MTPRLLFLVATLLAAPAQALELGRQEVHFESDCVALLTLRLMAETETGLEKTRVEIASPPTYRKLQKAYPPWVGSANLKRFRRNGEDRIEVRSAEPLPSHSSDLVLVLSEGYEPPTFYTLNLPPCAPTGTTREVIWGDTLLEIALEQARSLEVDVYALMLAIQLYNRDAFIHDNINLVRADARLYIPSPAEVALLNLSRQWLIDEIRFQNEQWRRWRREGTDPRESPTLKERRLRLLPLETGAEPAAPVPERSEPGGASPVEPKAEPAEPPPADAAASARTESERIETPPVAAIEVEGETLARRTNGAVSESGLAKAFRDLPWTGILAAAGILLLAYLLALAMRRARHARIIRQSVGDIKDPARRATSALDLAHARVEANEYDLARPLIRLVLGEGMEREREEAKKLRNRIDSR